ncbi:MAG: hypothetical protein ACPIOQ_07215, partial [Promethearchaeia archaeon]
RAWPCPPSTWWWAHQVETWWWAHQVQALVVGRAEQASQLTDDPAAARRCIRWAAGARRLGAEEACLARHEASGAPEGNWRSLSSSILSGAANRWLRHYAQPVLPPQPTQNGCPRSGDTFFSFLPR